MDFFLGSMRIWRYPSVPPSASCNTAKAAKLAGDFTICNDTVFYDQPLNFNKLYTSISSPTVR